MVTYESLYAASYVKKSGRIFSEILLMNSTHNDNTAANVMETTHTKKRPASSTTQSHTHKLHVKKKFNVLKVKQEADQCDAFAGIQRCTK